MSGDHTAKLSKLDLQMISHVPAGGNWKNIPDSVPSKQGRTTAVKLSLKFLVVLILMINITTYQTVFRLDLYR